MEMCKKVVRFEGSSWGYTKFTGELKRAVSAAGHTRTLLHLLDARPGERDQITKDTSLSRMIDWMQYHKMADGSYIICDGNVTPLYLFLKHTGLMTTRLLGCFERYGKMNPKAKLCLTKRQEWNILLYRLISPLSTEGVVALAKRLCVDPDHLPAIKANHLYLFHELEKISFGRRWFLTEDKVIHLVRLFAALGVKGAADMVVPAQRYCKKWGLTSEGCCWNTF